jgi:hypothetical protein
MTMFEGDRLTYYVPHDDARKLGRWMWLMGLASGLLFGVTLTTLLLNLWWPT